MSLTPCDGGVKHPPHAEACRSPTTVTAAMAAAAPRASLDRFMMLSVPQVEHLPGHGRRHGPSHENGSGFWVAQALSGGLLATAGSPRGSRWHAGAVGGAGSICESAWSTV